MYAELSSASSSPSSCCSPRFPSPRRTGSGMNGRAMVQQQRRGNRHRTLRSLMLRKSHWCLLLPFLSVIFIIFLKVPHSSLKAPFASPTYSPGSEYRSPQLFDKLWPLMLKENNSPFGNAVMRTWQRAKLDQGWRPCVSKLSLNSEPPPSNGYMVIEANGGLNQQRMSICDAVAVAGLLNATLVIPDFHFNSIWRDPSNFSDIFDEEHFIRTLQNDVRIVRRLPTTVLEKFNFNISSIVNLRLKASTSVKHYLKKVLPNLIENGVIRVSPFANRLPSEVPPRIQHLRCLANYEALRFSKPISSLADKLLNRMIEHSSDTNGKYVSIHLRFEEDMVAFSCCVYDGDKDEKNEMDAARERGWRGKFHRVGRVIRPSAIRLDGKCPLTPLEVGMMLRGMGYNNDTSIYLAAGKIYKSEKYMEPLKRMFPRLQTKETLATPEELAPFKRFSSRMAALDYTVCLNSEVFVTTQGGNFPHFLMGHRRYLNKGHSKTIKPDKRKLVLIFDNLDARWSHFKRDMQMMLHRSDLKGVEMKKVNGSIYSFPTPDCMCRHTTS